MPQLSLRYWFGIVAVVTLVVLGAFFLRPRQSLTTTPVAAAPSTANAISSASGEGEWSMEGYDPGRTRRTDSQVIAPINHVRTFTIADDKGEGSPVTIAKKIMLVEAEHRLQAISLETGKPLWSFVENGRYISPAVAGRTVFIRSEAANKGQVIALDLVTGQQRWVFTPRRLAGSETSFWGGHLTSPVVANGLVYIGAGKELYALDAGTGKPRWEYSGSDYVVSSATVGDGRVFISNSTQLIALDQTNGTVSWQYPTVFTVYFSPIVSGKTVYLTNDGRILALHTATGAKQWEYGIDKQSLLPSAVHGSRLLVKSTSSLYALDTTTGKQVWHADQSAFVAMPIVAGNTIYTVTGISGQLSVIALDIETGQRLWQQRWPTLATTAPVIADRTIYVRTTDGKVLGLFN